ncbi:MAG: FAD:protein FMN transferase [Alphaproteobacteria bacterium]|nr:FAD:protein FMN transferase [Alphaproteobacteria bacterium]
MLTRRKLLRLAGGAALLNVLPAAARAAEVCVHTGPAFGSAWRLVLPDTSEAAGARARLEAVVARIDGLMSPYRTDSELARFNAAGSAVVSRETGFVIRASLELAGDSDGAFDPTMAPLGRRYGFGPIAISPARPAGRYRDVRIAGDVLGPVSPGLSLDLCGIAKGYALDEIVRALDGLDFLVELGGEVTARGRHPSGRPWRMGVERPGTTALQRIVEADGRALATSGDGAQGYVVGRRRYAHVLDPRSRTPVDNGVASVSVLAATGLISDGLATAAMVLGPQDARPLLKAHGASALFLMRRSGGLEEVDLGGFIAGGAS